MDNINFVEHTWGVGYQKSTGVWVAEIAQATASEKCTPTLEVLLEAGREQVFKTQLEEALLMCISGGGLLKMDKVNLMARKGSQNMLALSLGKLDIRPLPIFYDHTIPPS